MLISILLLAAITAGGFAITYLFEDDESFMWRLAAGSVIGMAVFGTVSFLLAMAAGLNAGTVTAAIVLTMAPLIVLFRQPIQGRFFHDWEKAKGKLKGASRAKALRFAYYALSFIVLLLFFSQTMYQTAEGIFTGGSNNLGDLPYHIGAILSFSDGANFPPMNPSYAGAKFSYPFIADLVTACFMKLGAGLRDAMFVQNVVWAVALLVILERYVVRLTGDRLAGRLAPPLLFLSGGLGFLWFLGDLGAQSKGLTEFIWNLPKDYTIGDEFRWGNSLITLFMTQRSLLLGMQITLIVIGYLWSVFTKPATEVDRSERVSLIRLLIVGLIAGLLPLVHLHSLAVLFVIAAFLFFLRLDLWKVWVAFGVGVCLIAVPELAWSMTGSANEAAKFFKFHIGWDSRDNNIFWFWLKNTGLVFPMLIFGVFLLIRNAKGNEKNGKSGITAPKKGSDAQSSTETGGYSLLFFYLPFFFLFVIANIAKLAPWEWDNIKVLIYWYIGTLPLIGYALAWMWREGTALKVAAAVCLFLLTASGSLDVWRTISGANKIRVFDADAVRIGERLRLTTSANALFLNAPTYNSAVALTGRQSLMRYPGHLASHGIDYGPREADVKTMYAGGPNAEALLQRYGIDFVLISPEERSSMRANEPYFANYPIAAEVGQYKVYKIR
ncbi:MAG: hypothetical protein IPM25_11745 [Chloracidobacterium sp.]|nr:hypothetical protein [Chloracidobacterium sp.]